MKTYKLYKGFNKLGEYTSILEAKKESPIDDGVYNLIGTDGYRSSWQILKGNYYGE